MKKIRIFALSVALMMALTALAGCSTGASAPTSQPTEAAQPTTQPTEAATPKPVEKVTLMFSWWGNDARHGATNAAVDFWNKNNPNIQVQTAPSGWDGYSDKLLTQLSAGTAPDVFQISVNDITNFANKGQLLDLTPYLDTVFADYDASLKQLNMVDNKIYALSTGTNAPCLCYNKTLLDKLGIAPPTDNETFDSLLEKCKAATKDTNGDGKIDVWGIEDPTGNTEFTSIAAMQFGSPLFAEDGKSSHFDDPKVVDAYKMLAGFNDAGVTPKPGEYTVKENSTGFLSGYTAFAFMALSAYGNSAGSSADELNAVAFPVVAGSPEMRTVSGSVPMTVYSKGAHTDQALQFLAWFLTSADAATAQGSMVRGVFPAKAQRDALSAKAATDHIMTQQMRVADFFSTLKSEAKILPTPTNITEWQKIYTDLNSEYAYKKLTIEEFCKQVKEQGDPILAQ